MKAINVLDRAAELVHGDRAESHGDMTASFQYIATLWSARLGVTVTAADVCWCMSDVKFSRSKFGARNEDDFIDGAAYVAMASEVSDGD